MQDCAVRIGLKRKLDPLAQSASVIKMSPNGLTKAHSPPPAGPDSDDGEDFVTVDLPVCSQHDYAQPPPAESRVENHDTSTIAVYDHGVFALFRCLYCLGWTLSGSSGKGCNALKKEK